MTLMQKLRDWLPGKSQELAGETVTYTRAGETAITLTAVVGRVAFRSEVNGVRFELGDRDYLVKVEDLTLGEPRIGDRITQTIDGEDVTFAVQTPDTGEAAWRYSDPARTMYRLHCKRKIVVPDTTAPTVSSASVGGNGTTLTVVFSERVTAGAFTGLTLFGTFGPASLTYVSGDRTDTVTFTISREIGEDETVTRSYTPGDIEDLAGNDLASFSAVAVTNNSGVDGDWAPYALATRVLWLQAGPTWCFTDAGATVPAGNGDTVQVWEDVFDGTFTVSQSTAGDRPTLRLTGSDYDVRGVTDDWMAVVGAALDSPVTAYTVFIAGVADSIPGSLDTLFGFGANATRGIIRRAELGGANWEAVANLDTQQKVATSSTAVPVGSRFVIGIRVDPTLGSAQLKLYSGATMIASANQTGPIPASPGTMRLLTDAGTASRGWPGGIYELVACASAISDADLALLAAYLAA